METWESLQRIWCDASPFSSSLLLSANVSRASAFFLILCSSIYTSGTLILVWVQCRSSLSVKRFSTSGCSDFLPSSTRRDSNDPNQILSSSPSFRRSASSSASLWSSEPTQRGLQRTKLEATPGRVSFSFLLSVFSGKEYKIPSSPTLETLV